MKDLFHGTTYDISEIDLTHGKGYKDFGKGFYATAVKKHAENIARRNKRILEAREKNIRKRNPKYKVRTYRAYRYNLEFDDNCIDKPGDLKIKIFSRADREWVRFVLMNRDSDISMHNYDIVIGPTADLDILEPRLFPMLKYTVKLGNTAIHTNQKIKRDNAVLSLRNLFEFCK